jgi:polar amino acid transport system substrate-binding protein
MKKVLPIFGFLTFFLFMVNLSAEKVIIIYYFHRPPLYLTNNDGSAGGFIVEIVKNIFNEAKIPYQFREVSVKRVEGHLKRGDYACGIGWFKLPEREDFANFSDPIYRDQSLALIINKRKIGFLPEQATIQQILKSGLTLGVINGFSYGAWADENISKNQPKVEKIAGDQMNLLNMIAKGRCDYTLMGTEEIAWILQHNKKLVENLTTYKITDAPQGNHRYIMFNKTVDKDIIININAAIAKFIKTKQYKKLTNISNHLKN